MVKTWRPEGWKIPREVEDKSFEAGADAMLKSIIRWGDLYCAHQLRPRRECGHCWLELLEEL